MTILAQAPPIVGSAEPRIATAPLRDLNPDTSYGFAVIDFAKEIGHPLLPWQEVAVIRGGELLPDGRPRFRIVLLMVARQNGKTELPVVLSLFWQFRERWPMTFGTSTQLVYAEESWRKAVNLARRTPLFHDRHAPGNKWLVRKNGSTESFTYDGCRYKIGAANEEGGRSLTIDRGIMDELRQHKSYDAWDAMEPACSPQHAQIWCMTNAGDARSVVLNDHQDSAREFIETGVGDPRLGLLEWSAPEDAEPDDVDALLQANPRVGYGLDLDVLVQAGARAKRLGGRALAGFRTERMCVRVKLLNAAIDPRRWSDANEPGTLEGDRRRLAACFEISEEGDHATLGVAAVVAGDFVRVETVREWTGPAAAAQLERALPGLIAEINPRVLGWLPNGPGAAVAAGMKASRWPRGMKVEEIRSETPAVCMGFGKEVAGGTLLHSGQDMLNTQIEESERVTRAGGWIFVRKSGPCDAVYAVAGAAHLARTLPKPREVSGTVHVAG